MKKFIVAFIVWGLPFWAIAQKEITLGSCFQLFEFYPESGDRFQYLKDGVHYAAADANALHIHAVTDESMDSIITLNLEGVLSEPFDRFEFSPDEQKLLLRANARPLYRHSVLADYVVYDLKSNKAFPLTDEAEVQFTTFSPDGNKIAYVLRNNLYFKDLVSGKTTQITQDGKQNQIINGLADWVYEEEFSPVDGDGMVACKWSPDSRQLAYLRFDERKVPQMPMTWYEGGMYPRQSVFKYPKVGQPNSVVTAHIYDLIAGQTTLVQTGVETDIYLPRIHWTPANQLVVTHLNRAQSQVTLLQADNKTGASTQLLQENDAAYIALENENKLVFLKSGGFLWMSERSGWEHIHRIVGTQNTDLTIGNFDVTAFYGLDEKNGVFYYQTATPTPLERQIWEGRLDGTAPRLMTPGNGSNEAEFSPTFDYFTHTWQDANTPPVVTLRNRKGDVLRTFTSNERVRKLRSRYAFVNKEFFTIPIRDAAGHEVLLNAWAMKPANMEPGRKYPVLFDVYGGPGSQTVQQQYDGYVGSWHQMLVQKGYVVVSVDNRGTGARGRDFKKITQLQLGKIETEDQIAAARYLGTLPWVDASRIGIWGWSFGGYLSTSCILKGDDVFKMAMAVAPVTNWKWYDSAYTERYMRTTADNAKGYEDNSPVNFANRLRGDNYLICHGIADDNVHWQQTTEMINALVRANKQFETQYYPNRNHGIYGDNATMHLFTKLTEFVLEKL
jgi:dipeptidyl-peptidase 4